MIDSNEIKASRVERWRKEGRMATVLVLGSGGREHAISWKLERSLEVAAVLVAPGNGGTQLSEKVRNVDKQELDAGDGAAVVRFCSERKIDLVVVGPEAPLVDGIADVLCSAGVPCFGPSKSAARLEGSKAFSKDFMVRHNIPTAKHRNFTSRDAALTYVKEDTAMGGRVVVKASGLAAGKGVILPETTQDAMVAVDDIMVEKKFGKDAGSEVVIEELLEGPEVSLFVFSDGKNFEAMPASQDHKRIFDGDLGPNTGGMGAFCPTPLFTEEIRASVLKNIVERTIKGAQQEGFPFVGLLYVGLMLTKDGPKVLEYNCRFGDPETQAVLMLLKSDLFKIMFACAKGNLKSVGEIEYLEGFSAATIVAASKGYPGSYGKGKRIEGIDKAESYAGVKVFHAGTSSKTSTGELVTSGGRVLAVSAYSRSLGGAVDLAYKGMRQVSFEGMQYRKDIAARVLGKQGERVGSSLTLKTSNVAMFVAAAAAISLVAVAFHRFHKSNSDQ